ARAQRKVEHEVEQVQARRQRGEDRMASGAISAPTELANLQNELTALERRISTLEDDQLEVMEQVDEAQATLRTIEADLAAVNTNIAQAESARDTATGVIEEQMAEATRERAAFLASVPDDLVAL